MSGGPPPHEFRRLSPLTPLVRSLLVLVAGLATTWDDLLRGDLGLLAWAFLALVVGGAVFGTASWLRTKYWIEADELRVDTGVVSRQSRRIRVDRLQGIDIVQPLAARLLGLAELRMDVAGGSSREGSLAFLRLADARELREVLLARRDLVRAERTGDTPAADGDPSTVPVAEPVPERVIARLDLATLLVSLLLSTETLLLVVGGLVLGGVFLAVGEIGGLGVLPVVVGFVLNQFRKLTAYYGFTVAGTSAGLQVRRGLFELSTQTVALHRVQGVVVTEPLLWRSFGWARLDVSIAGSTHRDGDDGPSASTVMPVAPREVVLSLARTLLSEAGAPDLEAVALTPPPARSRWVAPVARRLDAGGIGAELVVGRAGLWNRRTHVVPHARVQSVQVRQGPWQRRLGLADLRVDSPPGPARVRLRHRDAGEAREWLDRESDLTRAARRART